MAKKTIKVLISGPPGSGKTLMGNAIALILADAGFEVEHDGLPVPKRGYLTALNVMRTIGVVRRSKVTVTTKNRDEV